jgi:tetratricopeptide (TPR) repeat protein
MPEDITANGIASAIFSDKYHMSYYLNNLIERKCIKSESLHVKNKHRKQKIYYLTETGRKKANEIKKRLNKMMITILNPNEKSIELNFLKVNDYLIKNNICNDYSNLQLCKLITESQVLDTKIISSQKHAHIKFIEDALTPEFFHGRINELNKLKKYIESKKKYNCIYIYGIGGIGKTSLVSKFIEEYLDKKNIFWHRFNEWDTLKGLLRHFAEFLSEVGRDNIISYFDTNKNLDLDYIFEFLNEDLKNLNSIIIFDDLHKANWEIINFFTRFIENIEKIENVKVIFVSRYNISFYDRQKALVKKSIAEFELDGLDFKSCKAIMRRKGIPENNFNLMYEKTLGNPLLLEICNSFSENKRYIYDEIFSQFTKEEQQVMEVISTSLIPIPFDALFINKNFSPTTINNLIKKLFIKENSKGFYYSHEFIKEFFYKQMSPSVRNKNHKSLGTWYINQGNPINNLEAIYHFIKASEYDKAIKLSTKGQNRIINKGQSERLLTFLNDIPEENVPLPQLVDLSILKGNLNFITGKWNESLKHYYHSIEVGTEVGIIDKVSKSYREIGHILEEQNSFNDALTNFQKSLSIYGELKDDEGRLETKRGIGRIYWRQSDYKNAEKYYLECLDILQNSNEPDLIGALHIDLGNIYFQMDKCSKSIEHLENATSHLNKTDNKLEIARAYNSLGSVSNYLVKFDNAVKYFIKQLEIAEKIGDNKLMGYGFSNISFSYAKLSQILNSKDYLKRAKNVYKKIRNENILFQILRTESLLNQHYKKWGKAIEDLNKSLAVVEKLNVQFFIADTYYEFGLLYEKKDDLNSAKKYYRKALKLNKNLKFKISNI